MHCHTPFTASLLLGLTLGLGSSAALAQSPCQEGCSPNYWQNHKERWDNLGTDDNTATVKWYLSFNEVFGVTQAQSGVPNSFSLHDATATTASGLVALNRQFAAAIANAEALCFPLTLGQVIDIYRDAVGAAPGPETVGSATSFIVVLNGQGCPLSRNRPRTPPEIFCVADQGDCPCGPGTLVGGCTNSSGLGARLDSLGSTSVSTDDLELIATQLPMNTAVLFLMADAPRRVPYLDGLFCVGGPMSKVFRIPPILNSGPMGTAQLTGGLVALSNTALLPIPGGIHAGETWYFQTYFRDVLGCGTGANTSNAIALTFEP